MELYLHFPCLRGLDMYNCTFGTVINFARRWYTNPVHLPLPGMLRHLQMLQKLVTKWESTKGQSDRHCLE